MSTLKMNLFYKYPRFQFFFKKRNLLKSLVSLAFTRLKKGNDVKVFENEMSTYFNVKYAMTTSSFRIGLFKALIALDLKKGDEVLLSPITIPETVNALLILGLVPVFVDIEEEYHFIDTKDLKEKITGKTKAVIVTYLSGIPPRLEKLIELTKSNKLFLIEDFSQNFGARSDEGFHGSIGDVSIGSLSCGKIISSTVGGIIFTNQEELRDKIVKLLSEDILAPRRTVLLYYLIYAMKVSFGTSRLVYLLVTDLYLKYKLFLSKQQVLDFEHDPYHRLNIFYTFKPVIRSKFPSNYFTFFCDWQARVALDMFSYFEQGLLKRRELAQVFLNHLSKDSLKYIPNGLLNTQYNSYYHFPIKCFGRRDDMRSYFFKNGIDSGSYGLNLCTEEEIFKNISVKLIGAEKVKHDTMYIPINEVYTKKGMIYMANLLNVYTKEQ